VHRVFIGVPLNTGIQRYTNALLKTIDGKGRGIRWVPEDNRHLTLAFPGEVTGACVKTLVCSLSGIYRHTARFPFHLSELKRFPGASGRILALTGEASASMTYLFHLTRNFLDKKGIVFDRREPRPHITLARLTRAQILMDVPEMNIDINLDIDRVRLYQSTLAESGPRYSVLQEARFGHNCS